MHESLQNIRVVVADDHPIVRAGIIHELVRYAYIDVVGEAANADQGLELTRKHRPDVLILDVSMPGTPVIEIVRRISQLALPTRTLMLTANLDLEIIMALLKSGATGYVLKDEEPETIILALAAVARGERWTSPSVTALLVNQALCRSELTTDETLSAREVEVIQQLAEGKDNNEIGMALHISERTVRFHLRNVYDKLGVRRGGAIAWGVRNGLVIAERSTLAAGTRTN